jgi:hypothetical protein
MQIFLQEEEKFLGCSFVYPTVLNVAVLHWKAHPPLLRDNSVQIMVTKFGQRLLALGRKGTPKLHLHSIAQVWWGEVF